MAEEKKPQEAAAGAAPAKKKESAGISSARKRDLQSKRRRLRNRSYHASVLTSIRSLTTSISQKEALDVVMSKLNAIYSLMDRGAQKGVYKSQKAARTKSRLSAKVQKLGR